MADPGAGRGRADGRAVRVLDFLDPDEAAILRGAMEIRSFAAGTELARDGGRCGFFGFLLSGRLAVRKQTSFPGRHTIVALLEPGAMVGGVPSAGAGECGAAVAVVDDAEILLMDDRALRRFLADHPVLAGKILERVIQVLWKRLNQAYDRLASLL